MLKIDVHTHILPPDIPAFKKQFGYGGFIQLEHLKGEACPCANMVSDSGKFFRKIDSNCYEPLARLEDCDKSGINVQVLSTVPVMFSYWAKPHDGLVVAKYLNDHIAEVVQKHPKRFIGLGTLPLQDPQLAIAELERCVNELGLAGIEIGTHVNEWNLSDEPLHEVFAACERLGAAVFVHPWDMMGKEKMEKYWLPWLVGMPAESSLALCSMIFSGVFKKFPKLRVCVAHGGGSFPATLGRIEHGHKVRPDLCAIDDQTNPRDYMGKFWLDSLVHDPLMLEYLIKLIGANRIALGTDYPFPLGELEPGKLIEETIKEAEIKEHLLSGSALSWLGLSKDQFL